MSKWVSRECALTDIAKTCFVEVGSTDFSGLAPGEAKGKLKGAVSFTVSLCGRFLIATHGSVAYIYELNHICYHERPQWSIPIQPREGLPLGLLRPVSIIHCPRRVICCSMDTSSGRNSAAFLMDGRTGLVAEIQAERLGPALDPRAEDPQGHHQSRLTPTELLRAPSVRNASALDTLLLDLSLLKRAVVALCPQRNCVAFGCDSGIELNWSDAITGQNLSRWFPSTSSSDHLYFLPLRQDIDTAKKLRLISSASAMGASLEHLGNMYHGFNTRLFGTGSTAVMSFPRSRDNHSDDIRQPPVIPSVAPPLMARQYLGQSHEGLLRRVTASTANHYRALPLSDGFHILFTDPCSGNLCLGTDAPVGALTRLLRKVWFPPPPEAISPVPILYAAGADVRHGVRIVATFEVSSAAGVSESGRADHYPPLREADTTGERLSVPNRQIVMFYTIPPDMFHDLARAGVNSNTQLGGQGGNRGEVSSEWAAWRADMSYHEIDIFSDPYTLSEVYPVEIHGQRVATCNGLVEIALDSSPDMLIWTFSAEGWARAWAFKTSESTAHIDTEVQVDGSLRFLDADGDVIITDEPSPAPSNPTISSGELPPFDGSATPSSSNGDSSSRSRTTLGVAGMSGTVSVDLVEDVSGITRVDVELR